MHTLGSKARKVKGMTISGGTGSGTVSLEHEARMEKLDKAIKKLLAEKKSLKSK